MCMVPIRLYHQLRPAFAISTPALNRPILSCPPLLSAMPGPHLELHLMQCYADVGGCDAWLSGFWTSSSQWWTGWHLPGPAGPAGLSSWQWPHPGWVLIGFELWGEDPKQVMESYYNHPNPSTSPAAEPVGHWHVRYGPDGDILDQTWSDDVLTVSDSKLYLKGGGSSPEGKGQGKGKGPKGKDDGKGFIIKGKGKGKAKGKAKGKDKGKGFLIKGKDGKGKAFKGKDGKGKAIKGKDGKGKVKGKGKGKGKQGKGKGKDS